MAVEHDRVSVASANALDFGGELRMIRIEVFGASRRDLAGVRRTAVGVERLIRERARRAELGVVGTRVERDSGRIAIQVDDVARVRRDEHRDARLAREREELLDMPIGVGKRARSRCQPFGKTRRQMGAGVRDVDDERRVAADEIA